MSDNNKKDDQDYETTGHSWDGIEEYNKPLHAATPYPEEKLRRVLKKCKLTLRNRTNF